MQDNKQLILRWVGYPIIIIYALINVDAWVKILTPSFYDRFFSKIRIYDLYNNIGFWILLATIILCVLHISKFLKMDKRVFWITVLVFLGNLLLIYLEIKRHGDA